MSAVWFDLRCALRRWRNMLRTRVWWRVRYGKRSERSWSRGGTYEK